MYMSARAPAALSTARAPEADIRRGGRAVPVECLSALFERLSIDTARPVSKGRVGSMSGTVGHIQCEAQLRWLLTKIINEAVAANLALERMIEMGYVSRECAARVWEQEKNQLGKPHCSQPLACAGVKRGLKGD